MTSKILLQVTAPAILTGVVLVGTSLGSAWSIHRLQANLGTIVRDSVVSVQASLDLENSTRRMRYHSLLYLIRPSAEGLAQIESDESQFAEAFARAEQVATLAAERDQLRRIGAGFEQYKREMARLRAQVARNGPFRDFGQLALTHPIRHITTPCKELADLNRDQLEQTTRDSNDLSRRSHGVLLLLGIAGPVGGLIGGYGIALGLNRSITRLRVRLRDVVDRLLPFQTTSSDHAIQLTLTADGDLHAMDQQLREVVQRVELMIQSLQQQQREILRAEQLAALGQLAASVAHEVRNPLTGMKLLVEAALRPGRPQPLSDEDLKVIHGEITRLEETVRHFLDFARPQPLVRQVVDLHEAIARPVELVRARCRQQGVSITFEPAEEPLLVLLDTGQFGTVVVNLLLNALDVMPHGGRIIVSVRREGNPEVSVLSIRDTGPGIAPDVLPRLFTPFASGKPTGTGLGLSLARRIVELHGGEISAQNLPQGGACFCIVLPVS